MDFHIGGGAARAWQSEGNGVAKRHATNTGVKGTFFHRPALPWHVLTQMHRQANELQLLRELAGQAPSKTYI